MLNRSKVPMIFVLPGDRVPRGGCLAQWSLPGPGDGAPLLGGRQTACDRLQQP